jgi:hypothetical protein
MSDKTETTVEERATAMGWLPKEEFKGDESNWRPAEEFLDRGENIMPILKERLGKMEKNLEEVTGRLEAKTQSLTKFAAFHKGTYKRAYDNAYKEIEKQKLAAVEAGNTEMYKDAQQREHDLNTEQAEMEKTTAEEEGPIPEFVEFQKNNEWFQKDVAMTAYIEAIMPGVAQTAQNDTDFFAKLEHAARLEFPHKFTPQAAANAVEGAGDGGENIGSTDVEKGWRDLPKDAQETYLSEFSDIEGFGKDDYAKGYFEQEGT